MHFYFSHVTRTVIMHFYFSHVTNLVIGHIVLVTGCDSDKSDFLTNLRIRK